MSWTNDLVVKPGRPAHLHRRDPAATGPFADKSAAGEHLERCVRRIDDLQQALYAEGKRSLLIVLQGMDGSGKDGTIRHVMSGVNPQGCQVTAFKQPTKEELEHDFLWRVHKVVPQAGRIGIFNRSHYEDVLVVRVHDLAPKAVWSKRYEAINAFENLLADNGVTILKFFLHISSAEQYRRLEARLDQPDKRWKATPGDYEERKFWPAYQEAYEDALTLCSTKRCPWHVIPADHKWFRNVAISKIIAQTLAAMSPRYPAQPVDLPRLRRLLRAAK